LTSTIRIVCCCATALLAGALTGKFFAQSNVGVKLVFAIAAITALRCAVQAADKAYV
jgi:hypothetical protein